MFRNGSLNGSWNVFSVLNAVLVIAIVVATLIMARDILLQSSRRALKTPIQPRPTQQARSIDTKDLEAILRNNPFSNRSETFKLITSTEKAVQTPSDYKLIGTISGDRLYSFAVFADKEGRQEIVRLGSPVGTLGTLWQVYKDKVIVKGNGRDTEITLADIVRIEEARQGQVPSQHQTSEPARQTSDFARQIGDRAFVVDQRKIQFAIDNPNQIMTDARLLPNIVDGVQRGFILREVRPGGIYQSLGLRDGDVLLRINEYNINNPESGLQAFMALKGLERVNLDIIRGGSNLTLTYLIK
jgi:general secretion pathway protein C